MQFETPTSHGALLDASYILRQGSRIQEEFNAAKKECLDYQAERKAWEKTYGEKAMDSVSIREKLRQKEQIVKEREAGRVHPARQKKKGAR